MSPGQTKTISGLLDAKHQEVDGYALYSAEDERPKRNFCQNAYPSSAERPIMDIFFCVWRLWGCQRDDL